MGYRQFSPNFINSEFAGYTVKSESTRIFTDESLYMMKKKFIRDQSVTGYIFGFCGCRCGGDDDDDDDDDPAMIEKVLKHYAD